MEAEAALKSDFENLQINPEATLWLCDMWAVIQLFDDVADGDNIQREQLDRVIWSSLVGMNRNRFWIQNSLNLLPIIETMIFKWQASDQAERAGRVNEQSYMWRAGFYDLVLMVYYLCHGEHMARNQAEEVLSLYGEQYKEYSKEFDDA